MRASRMFAVAAVTGVLAAPAVAQQPPDLAPASVPAFSPEQIKQELEKIKKGRTLALSPAPGMDDTDGETLLQMDNESPFSLVVFVVGPTTERIELEPDHTQTLNVERGVYEIAVTVVGHDVPPFYGKQRILAHMRFHHQFVIPGV